MQKIFWCFHCAARQLQIESGKNRNVPANNTFKSVNNRRKLLIRCNQEMNKMSLRGLTMFTSTDCCLRKDLEAMLFLDGPTLISKP